MNSGGLAMQNISTHSGKNHPGSISNSESKKMNSQLGGMNQMHSMSGIMQNGHVPNGMVADQVNREMYMKS